MNKPKTEQENKELLSEMINNELVNQFKGLDKKPAESLKEIRKKSALKNPPKA